jgi:cell division inhibitor SepF
MGFKDRLDKILYGEPEVDYTENGEEQDEDYGIVSGEQADKATRPSNVSVSSGSSIEMKVVKPDRLDAVTQIADHLLDRKTILLNLEDTNRETARRLIDFLNGVAYAINGNLKKVANCTYVITPSNVDVSGEQIKESQESGNIL